MTKDRPARIVLQECLGLTPGQQLLIVTDDPTAGVGELLRQEGIRLGAETLLIRMTERKNSGVEPPPPVAAAMAVAQVVVLATAKSLSHTQARHRACQAGARVASMPGITEDMLERTLGGTYEDVARRSRWLAGRLSGDQVRIMTPVGTDLTFSIAGRQAQGDDGDLTMPGAFGNLPAGEAYIAPVEGSARGTLVVDGSMSGLGRITEPLVIRVENGLALEVQGGPQAGELNRLLSRYGQPARNIAELGIGTNPYARLTGAILEDEKMLGTIHIALGDNSTFGGTVQADSHLDAILLSPTVYLDGVLLVDDGRLILPEEKGEAHGL